MWHGRRRRRLGLVREHRIALLRNLAVGLIEHSRIKTLYGRAKETARFTDQLITIAKRGSLHARRVLISKLSSPSAAKRLVEDIAPVFKDRQGGYTRVLRNGFRPGDGAEVALVEFTQIVEKRAEDHGQKKKKEKKEKPEKTKKVPSVEKPAKIKKKKEETRSEQDKIQKQEKPAKELPPSGSEKQKDEKSLKEEPKKGGFLGNLRKFLTGD